MRLAFGRYLPSNSVVHRMNSKLKLVMIVVLMASVFFPVGITGLLTVLVFSLLLMLFSKINPMIIKQLLKPVLFIFIIMIVVNVFTNNSSSVEAVKVYHKWGIFELVLYKNLGDTLKIGSMYISELSAYRALYMSIRIFLTILLATILTSTTKPVELTIAIEWVLSPLKLIKIPVYIFSTIISIALRMIPTLIDEAGRIMKAQSSRGIDFKNGKITEKSKSIISLIIPLLVSSFQKAEDLAYAMDARGYSPHGKRTRYHQSLITIWDIIIFLVCVSFAAFVIVYAYNTGLNSIQIPRVDKYLGILPQKNV